LFVVESSSHPILKLPATLSSMAFADLARYEAERGANGETPGTSSLILTDAPRAARLSYRDVVLAASQDGRSYNPSGRLEGELVPETRYCSEVRRTAWIVFQLVPEFHNVIIDAAVSGVRVSIAAN